MITQSRLPAVASGGVSLPVQSGRSSESARQGMDFYSVMSQLRPDGNSADSNKLAERSASNSENAKVTAQRDSSHNARYKSACESAAQTSQPVVSQDAPPVDEGPSDTDAKSSDGSEDDSKDTADSKDGTASSTTNLDASTASTILALMAQAKLPVPEAPKLGATLNSNALLIVADAGTPKESALGASTLSALLGTKPGELAVGKDGKPASSPKSLHGPPAKPVLGTLVDSPPADNAASAESSPESKGNSPVTPQLVVAQLADATTNGTTPPSTPNGTTAALNGHRMRFVTEKNENAESTGQKLPGDGSDADSSTSRDKSTVTTVSDALSEKKNDLDFALNLDYTPKSALLNVEHSAATTSLPAMDHTGQTTRLAHLVNQEVVMIRQSGADSLAVSLKLDPHTELFLQLTNHNGQIQASIRCERGDLAGLDNHWSDLQESLAKQNVQLMPLENNKTQARLPAFTPAPASTPEAGFNLFRENSRQTRTVPQEPSGPVSARARNSTTTPKTKSRNSGRDGWESWA